jgi:hypothetical protein
MASELPALPELVRDAERSEYLAVRDRSTSATARGAGKHRTLFHSVLFPRVSGDIRTGAAEAPDFFTDLNLDQVIAAIAAGREEYDLRPLFHTTLSDPDAVRYRQEVMRDVERPSVSEPIRSFSKKMQAVRKCVAEADKAYYQLQGRSRFGLPEQLNQRKFAVPLFPYMMESHRRWCVARAGRGPGAFPHRSRRPPVNRTGPAGP